MSRSQAEIAAALKEAFAAGAMLAFEPPGSGGLVMAVERRQVEQAMSLWSVMPAPIREDRISSVRREVRRGFKRIARLSQKERDDHATDCILLLAHDLVFADGDTMLRDMPQMPDLSRFEQ